MSSNLQDLAGIQKQVSAQDIDVTVLAFAQWLSEMRSRSNSSLQQMLAEMGIIRNGITSNNTDLAEFKRNTATVQQQMQSQISDLRDKLTDAYTEIVNIKKAKSQLEQEVHSECQTLAEQLRMNALEMETVKKTSAQSQQQLQQQIIQLQTEVTDLRQRGDDTQRQSLLTRESNLSKVTEIDMATQYANTELKRLRSEHEQAIANLAENMTRWNDTMRDLSKEFHDFQKVTNVNSQRIQSALWDLQGPLMVADPLQHPSPSPQSRVSKAPSPVTVPPTSPPLPVAPSVPPRRVQQGMAGITPLVASASLPVAPGGATAPGVVATAPGTVTYTAPTQVATASIAVRPVAG
mmetsp:Transcript_55161/g.129146  ORF Transcript_55161/g.129146 Transcript_55161/m.129146 type:complete len:349 (-) Transcript_55161:50-1096(-)